MKLLKEKKGKTGSELIYKIEKADQFQLQEMNQVNQLGLPAILPMQYSRTPLGGKLQFHVEGMVCLTQHQPHINNLRVLLELIRQITNALIECQKAGIPLQRLELYPQHIFYNMRTRKVGLLYWPLLKTGDLSSPAELFYGLGINYACKSEEYQYWNEYLNFTRREDGLELEQFAAFLSGLWKRATGEENGGGQMRTKPFSELIKPGGDTQVLIQQKGTSGENLTVCLLAPMLLHLSRQEKIMLERLPFSIGRIEGWCDYVVHDSTVSKKHAVFFRDNTGLMAVQDNHSLNGTWVNGIELEPGAAHRLQNGDRIQIGCETFLYNEQK